MRAHIEGLDEGFTMVPLDFRYSGSIQTFLCSSVLCNTLLIDKVYCYLLFRNDREYEESLCCDKFQVEIESQVQPFDDYLSSTNKKARLFLIQVQ